MVPVRYSSEISTLFSVYPFELFAQKDEVRWHTVPRGTAIKIYRHYFADFGTLLKNLKKLISVLLGYSPNDAMRFIDSTNFTKPEPSKSLRLKSYNNMKKKRQHYYNANQDFICRN